MLQFTQCQTLKRFFCIKSIERESVAVLNAKLLLYDRYLTCDLQHYYQILVFLLSPHPYLKGKHLSNLFLMANQ